MHPQVLVLLLFFSASSFAFLTPGTILRAQFLNASPDRCSSALFAAKQKKKKAKRSGSSGAGSRGQGFGNSKATAGGGRDDVAVIADEISNEFILSRHASDISRNLEVAIQMGSTSTSPADRLVGAGAGGGRGEGVGRVEDQTDGAHLWGPEVVDTLRTDGFVVLPVAQRDQVVLSELGREGSNFFSQALLDKRTQAGDMRGKKQVGYGIGGSMEFLETRFCEEEGMLGVDFRQTTNEAADVLTRVAEDLLRLVESRLGVEEGAMLDLADLVFQKPGRAVYADNDCQEEADPSVSNTVLRLVHYPAIDDKEGGAFPFGPHTDTTFLTIIPISAQPGLEVWNPRLEAWVCPEISSGVGGGGGVCVMAGELLQVCSGGRVKASVHRVWAAKGNPRTSSPLLLRHAEKVVDRTKLSRGQETLRNTVIPHNVSMEKVWKSMQFGSDAKTQDEARSVMDKVDRSLGKLVESKRIGERTDVAIAVRRSGWRRDLFYSKFGHESKVRSESPLIVEFGDLMDQECCREVIEIAEEKFKGNERLRSTVVADDDQKSSDDEIRTSQTCWLKHDETPGLLRLARLASDIAECSLENVERFQLAKYQGGEQYKLHTDHVDSFNDFECGGRWSTFIFYLTTAGEVNGFSGGKTVFPYASAYPESLSADVDGGIAINPRAGCGVFFHNVLNFPITDTNKFDLKVDERSAHAGEPAIGNGSKYILTLWFHPVPL